jgi:phosphotransferase family enzyme
MVQVPVPVPDDLDTALTPQWLTAALQPRYPGLEVRAVARGPVVERLSTNARFTIECDGPAAVPRQLCIKGYFGDAGRAIRFVGEPEAGFYRDLADSTGVRTLTCVYADIDAVTRHGVVISEDVVAAGGEFLDGSSSYSAAQVATSLEEFARLHASTWNDSRLHEFSWLKPRMSAAVDAWGEGPTLDIMAANLLGPNGAHLPAGVRDARLLLAAHRSVGTAEVQNRCVIHGDAHVGNLFLDSYGRPGLVDWQLVQRGAWSTDVGYHIAATLPVNERRRTEGDLLKHYLGCLESHGVQGPPFSDAWSALGAGIVHGFFLWSITTKVDPAVIRVLLTRLGNAAADHDALKLGTSV